MRNEERQMVEAQISWLGNKGEVRVVKDGVNSLIVYDAIGDVYARSSMHDRSLSIAVALKFAVEHQKLFTAWLEKTHGSK